MPVLIKVLTWMASPIEFLVWVCALGATLLFTRWKKSAGALISLAIPQLVTFASPIVSDHLVGELEEQARVLESKNKEAERLLTDEHYAAIVLLGGAAAPTRLHKEGLAPKIIVSGGPSPRLEDRADLQTDAQVMAQLLNDLGVPKAAIVLEAKARNTRENAEKTKTLVGSGRAALVTSAFHMPRSIATFDKARIKADAYTTDFQVAPDTEPRWARLLPTASALKRSETALREYIAMMIRY